MTMVRCLLACALASCCAWPAGAQIAADNVLPPVEIRSKKNPGNVPYAAAYKLQQRVMALLPPEPRVIDMRFRVVFASLSLQERDDFMPANWGVAVVGKTVDATIPMARGGYFLLPDLPVARSENAALMFNTQTEAKYLGSAWSLRVREGNLLPYRDFAKAIDEINSAKGNVGRNDWQLAEFRAMTFKGLRACFANAEGAVLLNGAASGAVARGRCWHLKFDAAMANADASLAFIGELESLTLD